MTPTVQNPPRTGRRNYYLMIAEGALFWAGQAFIEPNTVVSVFVNEFSGNVMMAGLAATVRLAAMIVGQFLMGMVIYRITDHGKFLKRFGFFARMSFWFVLPPLLMGYEGMPVVLWFILLYGSFFFMDGIVSLSWFEINSHTISPRDRGPLAGYQQFFSALVGLLAATAIKLLMDSPLPPTQRYAYIFGLAAFVFFINSLLLRQLKDTPPSQTAKPAPRSFARYVRAFVPLWRSSSIFREVIAARILYNAGIMAAALLVLFGRQVAGITAGQASTMVYIQVLGQLAGGLSWGAVSRHMGNGRVMQASQLLSVVIGALGIAIFLLAGHTSLFIPCALMVFFSGLQNSSYHGYNSTLIDQMPKEQLTGYVVLQSLLVLPLAALPYVAGILADTVSFLPVFILIILFGFAGLYQTTRLRGMLREHSANEAAE